jgi:hypothetical protein
MLQPLMLGLSARLWLRCTLHLTHCVGMGAWHCQLDERTNNKGGPPIGLRQVIACAGWLSAWHGCVRRLVGCWPNQTGCLPDQTWGSDEQPVHWGGLEAAGRVAVGARCHLSTCACTRVRVYACTQKAQGALSDCLGTLSVKLFGGV